MFSGGTPDSRDAWASSECSGCSCRNIVENLPTITPIDKQYPSGLSHLDICKTYCDDHLPKK